MCNCDESVYRHSVYHIFLYLFDMSYQIILPFTYKGPYKKGWEK